MAVQQNKLTRSKRGMRRSHKALSIPNISKDKISKEFHLRHHITNNGFYKGKKILHK